jgi:hypothetical protein
MKILFGIGICAFFVLGAMAEPAPPAPKEFSNFDQISGFHSHFDKGSGFVFRILEVDGSATVALDPIYLYLVATNNSSADDLESAIVTLPKVSSIRKIKFFDRKHIIVIEASFDRTNEEGKIWTVAGTIEIAVPIKAGRLPKSIDVTVKMKDRAEGADGQAAAAVDSKP